MRIPPFNITVCHRRSFPNSGEVLKLAMGLSDVNEIVRALFRDVSLEMFGCCLGLTRRREDHEIDERLPLSSTMCDDILIYGNVHFLGTPLRSPLYSHRHSNSAGSSDGSGPRHHRRHHHHSSGSSLEMERQDNLYGKTPELPMFLSE